MYYSDSLSSSSTSDSNKESSYRQRRVPEQTHEGVHFSNNHQVKPNSLFETKFLMTSHINIHMWLNTFKKANNGLDSKEKGLSCVCMLDDAVIADISQHLPANYRYKDVKKALIKIFGSSTCDHIDRDNFLNLTIKDFDNFPKEFRSTVSRLKMRSWLPLRTLELPFGTPYFPT